MTMPTSPGPAAPEAPKAPLKRTETTTFEITGFKITVTKDQTGDAATWPCPHCHAPGGAADEGPSVSSLIAARLAKQIAESMSRAGGAPFDGPPPSEPPPPPGS